MICFVSTGTLMDVCFFYILDPFLKYILKQKKFPFCYKLDLLVGTATTMDVFFRLLLY